MHVDSNRRFASTEQKPCFGLIECVQAQTKQQNEQTEIPKKKERRKEKREIMKGKLMINQ